MFDKEIHMPGFLERHTIDDKLRSRMMDWLIEIRGAFSCTIETYFLACALFDTYLHKALEPVDNKATHLLGITCIYIASKHEDITPLFMKSVCKKIGHGQFHFSEVKAMELDLLNTLQWKVTLVTPLQFIFHFGQKLHSEYKSESTSSQVMKVEKRATHLCMLAQMHLSMMNYRPSERACAAFSVALDQLLTEENGLNQSHYLRIQQTVSLTLTLVQEKDPKRLLQQHNSGRMQGTTGRVPEEPLYGQPILQ